MVRKIMYQKIHYYKKKGLNKSEISVKLNFDRKTVQKYFDMSEENYRNYLQGHMFRNKLLDNYLDEIIEVYSENNFNRLNMAAVYDYLEEEHGKLHCSEKSLRNYISFLIETGKLEIKENIRLYSKVPELEFGKQMQLDFGQFTTRSGLKLYIFGSLLSSSRFKFAVFQDKPFTAKAVISHLLDCFKYFGGVPKELVIDQDSLMVVSENSGDILFTKDFECFIQEIDLKMYVCRKADPESKGKIENFIKYIKKNFLSIRDFNYLDNANNKLQTWLTRRANGKISRATKQIPANLIAAERKCLRSIPKSIFQKDSLLEREERIVNDKSFISVKSCQYSVPIKYCCRKVEIYISSAQVFVFDIFTGKQVAVHAISPVEGKKIADRAHFRETETSSRDLKDHVLQMFSLDNWKIFSLENFKIFPRYIRDQCIDGKKYFTTNIEPEILSQALAYCIENKTWSFRNLKDTYDFICSAEAAPEAGLSSKKIKSKKPEFKVSTRNLDSYRHLLPAGADS